MLELLRGPSREPVRLVEHLPSAAWGTSHKKEQSFRWAWQNYFVVFAAVAHVHLTRREPMLIITLNGDRGGRAARAAQ